MTERDVLWDHFQQTPSTTLSALSLCQIFATLAENVYWNNISFRFANQPDLTPIYPKTPKFAPKWTLFLAIFFDAHEDRHTFDTQIDVG